MYLVMLFVGMGFLLITVFAGELFDMEGTSFSLLRPSVIAVMLVTAGALGHFVTFPFTDLAVLPAVLLAGLGLGYLLTVFVIGPLHKLQNTSTVNQQDLIGLEATVDSQIAQGGYGRIIYTVNGSRVQSPAKTTDGSGLGTGTKVEIQYIEGKTFHVKQMK